MSKDWGTRGRAERQAINSLIQGSAADLIKTAMVRVNEGLKATESGRLLLTVHDELVARSTVEEAEMVEKIMREGMIGAGIQKMVDVPLSIDLHIADNWAEAK
jgi:DNA polymerase-1